MQNDTKCQTNMTSKTPLKWLNSSLGEHSTVQIYYSKPVKMERLSLLDLTTYDKKQFESERF